MAQPEPETGLSSFDRNEDAVDEAALAQAMRDVPRGAMALAGAAVALLTIAWVAIYLLVFVPRGVVG